MRMDAEVLVQKYQQDIFRAALVVTCSRAGAEDAVQEAFYEYLKSEREFESESHIKAWLIRTAVNKARNEKALFFNKKRADLKEEIRTMPFEEEEDRDLAEEVLRLPASYREVIHLYYYEGCPVGEIAHILGTSEGAVKQRLLRARKKLKRFLEEDGYEAE